MPIGTPVQRYAASTTETTTKTFSPGATIASGTVAVMLVTTGANKSVTAVSDSVGNTWTVDKSAGDGTRVLSEASCQVATQITTADTISVGWSVTASTEVNTWVFECPGLSAASVADKSATAGATNTSPSVSTAALAQANELVFGLFRTTAGTTTWTKGATYSDPTTPTQGSKSACEYKIVSSTAAVTADGTWGTSGTWIAGAFTFKGAGGGSTTSNQALNASVAASYAPQLQVNKALSADFGVGVYKNNEIVNSVGKIVPASVASVFSFGSWQYGKLISGAATASFTESLLVGKNIIGSATAAGSLVKFIGKPLAPTVAAVASMLQGLSFVRTLSAAVGLVGSITNLVGHVYAQAISAIIDVDGSYLAPDDALNPDALLDPDDGQILLIKQVLKPVTGSVTSSFSYNVGVSKSVSADPVSLTPSLLKMLAVALSDVVVLGPALIKSVGKPMTTDAVASVASETAGHGSTTHNQAATAAVTATATMSRQMGKTASVSVSSTVSKFSRSMAKKILADSVAGAPVDPFLKAIVHKIPKVSVAASPSMTAHKGIVFTQSIVGSAAAVGSILKETARGALVVVLGLLRISAETSDETLDLTPHPSGAYLDLEPEYEGDAGDLS